MGQIDTEEYIKGHISRVRKHMNTFVQLLLKRAINHDKSKLEEPELSWWKEMASIASGSMCYDGS